MPAVRWRRDASFDLLTIVDYISDDNPDLAERLARDIDASARLLADNPKMGRPGRLGGTRELVFSRSFVLVYAEGAEAVEVLRILHTAQQWP